MSDTKKSDKKNTYTFRFIKPLLHLHLDDSSAYALLMFLCVAARNETGESWHGHASIRYATGMSEKTISSATDTLVGLAIISCEKRGNVNNHVTKRYVVSHERLIELAELGKAGRMKFITDYISKRTARQQRWRKNVKASKVDGNSTVYKEAEITEERTVVDAHDGDVDGKMGVSVDGNSTVSVDGNFACLTTKYEHNESEHTNVELDEPAKPKERNLEQELNEAREYRERWHQENNASLVSYWNDQIALLESQLRPEIAPVAA